VAGEYLLLRAHLPYWEGLIHIVERASQLLGTERADQALPGVWNPFEAGVWAILAIRPDRDRALADFITMLGTAVPGLPGGLTHTFPDPGLVTASSLDDLDLSATQAQAIQALALQGRADG
jgi:AraC family transcriptional regulator of adaptative response / DNA-3-methyladenine glycosylase II